MRGSAPSRHVPALGIMRSTAALGAAEMLGFRHATPHNASLRIIRLGLTRSAGVVWRRQ